MTLIRHLYSKGMINRLVVDEVCKNCDKKPLFLTLLDQGSLHICKSRSSYRSILHDQNYRNGDMTFEQIIDALEVFATALMTFQSWPLQPLLPLCSYELESVIKSYAKKAIQCPV